MCSVCVLEMLADRLPFTDVSFHAATCAALPVPPQTVFATKFNTSMFSSAFISCFMSFVVFQGLFDFQVLFVQVQLV